jgi:rare lipoprotein A (peptidoglycan hydrolase)
MNKLRRSVRKHRAECKRSAGHDLASWYAPEGTASGIAYNPGTIGVAHKTHSFGSTWYFRHARRTVKAPVIDRGPYIAGREWDLTSALADALRFDGVGYVRVSRHDCWRPWR